LNQQVEHCPHGWCNRRPRNRGGVCRTSVKAWARRHRCSRGPAPRSFLCGVGGVARRIAEADGFRRARSTRARTNRTSSIRTPGVDSGLRDCPVREGYGHVLTSRKYLCQLPSWDEHYGNPRRIARASAERT
jgi:hypothetical protein